MSTLGQRLRKARENKGWSQTYVCKKLGISNSTLSGYERDYREPDADMITTLANLYDVSTDYLLGKTNNPTYRKDKDEEEFQEFIKDPELKRWYKELPKSNEEELRKLRKLWEIIKSEEE